MRVMKDPDVRKQEILDGAIRLFARKGYEKTTTADISRELNISQGLCYRYYPTKEAIYDAALEKYADMIVAENLKKFDAHMTIVEMIDRITLRMDEMKDAEKEDQDLYLVFHSENGRKLHDELFLRVTKKIIPHVQKHLRDARERGEIQLEDTDGAAIIGMYGWMGVLMTEGLNDKERAEILSVTWKKLLGIQ